MTPINFGITRSKLNVIVTLNVKMVSTDYLEIHLSQSSYFTCGLDMTSTWPLFILGSLGQRSRSQWPWMLKWILLIIVKSICPIIKSSYFTCRFVMTSRWPLLILWAVCQRSTSQWPCMSKWFTLIFLKLINHSKQCESIVRKGGICVVRHFLFLFEARPKDFKVINSVSVYWHINV